MNARRHPCPVNNGPHTAPMASPNPNPTYVMHCWIENARPRQFVADDLAGHGGERSQRVYRVVVAEQKQWFGSAITGKVNLQVIAKFLRRVKPRFASEQGKFPGDGLGDPIDGRFVVAGRFHFDQLADGCDDPIAAVVEVCKTALRFGAGRSGSFSGKRIHGRVFLVD